jgi:hypothetical protein
MALLVERRLVVVRGVPGTEGAVARIVTAVGPRGPPVDDQRRRLGDDPAANLPEGSRRPIAGTALAEGLALVTADKPIRESRALESVW